MLYSSTEVICIDLSLYSRALSFFSLGAALLISVSLTPSIIAGFCMQHA